MRQKLSFVFMIILCVCSLTSCNIIKSMQQKNVKEPGFKVTEEDFLASYQSGIAGIAASMEEVDSEIENGNTVKLCNISMFPLSSAGEMMYYVNKAGYVIDITVASITGPMPFPYFLSAEVISSISSSLDVEEIQEELGIGQMGVTSGTYSCDRSGVTFSSYIQSGKHVFRASIEEIKQ